jgi:CheY-like chemotaxis protein
MMPKLHGFELLEWVKANPECRQTRIMVLTAKSYRRDAEKARQSGAAVFLTKPFDVADLQAKVDQLLS